MAPRAANLGSAAVTDDQATCSCHLQIRSDPAELAGVRDCVLEVATGVGFTEKEVADIILAVDEALTNVIRHGYGGPCKQPIDIHVERCGSKGREAISVSIRDFGKQFDPEAIAGRPLEEVRPGGLGIHIMKSVMDQVSYAPADGGGMMLTMTKKKSP